jgi:UDP-N-acetylmuramate--alanine ligase
MNQAKVKRNTWNSANEPFRLQQGHHVHLIGIGGSGMSAIAWVLLGRGYVVSGSDLQGNETVAELARQGATIYEGHEAANIADADVVVVSSAVPATNVEVQSAMSLGLPVLKRAAFMGALMADSRGVAVAGSHGKTTTTGLIAHVLLESGRDPSVIAGGTLPTIGRNGRAGHDDIFVVEADEYDYMFLGLSPDVAVITNVEHDHPDLFATEAIYREAFAQFIARLQPGGTLVACSDDPGVRSLLAELEAASYEVVTYGLELAPGPDLWALDLRPNQLGGTDFLVQRGEVTLGLARLRLPGEHNVRNALATVAVCDVLQVPFQEMYRALASFGGVGRRFQVVGEAGDVVVIDDYAHHPTEIRATLAAARQRYPGRRLWAVWQPHTYSRTKHLLAEFARSFADADKVIVLDIFRSRERDTLGMDAAQVVAAMEHEDAAYVGARERSAAYILDRIRPGDVVLTLGAGDGNVVGEWVLDGLRSRLNQDH